MKTGKLDDFLEQKGFDAFFMHDDSASNANLYYLIGFEASDPFSYIRKNGKSKIIVSQLEYSRASEEAEVDEVINSSSIIKGEIREERSRKIQLLNKFFREEGVENLAVPVDFPLGLAEKLEEEGLEIEPVEDKVMEARKIKTEEEAEKLRKAQRLTEEAMRKGREMLEEAKVEQDKLYLNGEKLTSEKLRNEIKKLLIDHDCDVPHETIVASGKESAKPHATGSGEIKAGEPIVIDIFPRKDRYFGDMTRTYVKGEPKEELKQMKNAVEEALEKALEMFESGEGVRAKEVHGKVCDVLEKKGYSTVRKEEEIESGFMHSTGHAVGLELHEPPRISGNKDMFKAGNVLTVEPGLYLPEIGGLRIEEMILVKENGYENFNSMSRDIQID